MLSDLFFRFRSLLHRKSAEAELDAELQFHFEHAVEKNVRAGMSREEAARRARFAFGGLEQVKEDCHVAWGTTFVEAFLQDIRFGARMLMRSPGFSIIALLTLALGIGAATAIFSVVDAVLLRSLPYRDASHLVSLYEDRTSTGFPRKDFTPANYADCKEQKQIFTDVAAIDRDRFYNLTNKGAVPERLSAEGVSWNLFSILGTSPLLGRVFRPEEDAPGADHVVLISHRLWRDKFGGTSTVIGQDIHLNGKKYSVVGVMPSGFSFPNKSADLWVPIAFTSQGITDRGSHYLMVVAKLEHGVSVQRANAELLAFSKHLKQQHMDVMRFVDGFVAEPLQEIYTREVRGGLIVLQAAVGFILLIACANIANLLLSRANVRRREIALRGALGATQSRIVRQLLTESALLASAGGIIGVILAHFSFGLLKVLIPADLSRTISLTLNLSVLGVAILISFASVFLCGLAPALQMSKTDLNESLKQGGRGNAGMRRKSLSNLLVAGEIALCLILLIGSGLLIESFVKLRRGDPGFRSDHVLTLGIPMAQTENPDFVRRSDFVQTILERVRALPGVRSAGFTSLLPLTWKTGMAAGFLPEGVASPEISYAALDGVVSPGYFETMRVPLVRGRLFDERDGPDAPSVAIVNQTMARKFWPNQDALDKRFSLNLGNGNFRSFQIVGIIGDLRQKGLDAPPKEEMYFPYWQANGNYMVPSTLVIRAASDPEGLASAVRKAIWSVDPNQPVTDVMTMDDVLDSDVLQRRVQGGLLSGLAALALVLACVGIYGVMAYLVAQRTQEMGIRMALGAQRMDVLALIIGEGMKIACLGIVIGLLGAAMLTRLMASLLFGTSPTDPLTYGGVSLLLLMVTLIACCIPAHRATRIDPVLALRAE